MADNTKDWGDWLTPDLANNPGAAYDVSKSPNPKDAAYVVSHSIKTSAAQNAVNDHKENNNSDGFWNQLGHKAVTGLEWVMKPLQEVQRDYKFIHSVYANHGFLNGFVATLGVTGGAVLGTFAGGPTGTVLGAELAATALRKLSNTGPFKDHFSDSYKDSENALYKVSAGRDFSNAIASASDALGADGVAKVLRQTDAGLGKIVSGTGDLAFIVTADPVMVLGKFAQSMRAGKEVALAESGALQVKYPIQRAIPGARDFIMSHTGRAVTSEQMDAVRAGSTSLFGLNKTARTYNRALDDIARSTAGEIVAKYPALGVDAAGHLGKIKDAGKVHEFLKTVMYFGEQDASRGAVSAILPSRTLLRDTASKFSLTQFVQGKAVYKFTEDAAGKLVENPEWKRFNLPRLAQATYKTFTGYMPYSIDDETGKLLTNKFRWNSQDAATNIYRIAKFGMGDEGAKLQAGRYAEAVAVGDFKSARLIKNETVFETFKAMGLHDDNFFVKTIKTEIDNINAETVGAQVYGVSGVTGEALGSYMTANGPKVGGLFEHHATEMFDIPNFNAIRASLHEAGNLSSVYGKFDDFIADQYVNKIFKPLALMTSGFGLRVSAAEMLPTIARFGVINTFKSSLAKSAAKVNYKLAKGEAEHLASASLIALGAKDGIAEDVMTKGFPAFRDAARRGFVKAAAFTAPEQLELASRLMMTNGGHLLKEAVSTGHGLDASIGYQMETAASYFAQIKKNSNLFKGLPDFTTYQASDPHFVPLMQNALNKAAKSQAEKNIASDLLTFTKGKTKLQVEDDVTKAAAHAEFMTTRDELIAEEYRRMQEQVLGKYDGYKYDIQKLSRWGDGDLYQFASDRVDATLGKLVGQNGTIQRKLASDIVMSKEIQLNDLIAAHSANPLDFPKMVEGPIMMEPPRKGWYNNAIDIGFKKFIDPIINNLSREPMYMLHVAEEYGFYAAKVKAGELTEDQALRFAQQRAVHMMVPQIHNVALRSQFSQMARNVLPFYFAQEQALKRAYATLKDTAVGNPLFSKGLRYFQIAEHGLSDPAFVQQDDQGNKFVTLPGVGAFGEAVQKAMAFILPTKFVGGLPISAQGNLISLKTVLPEFQMPGVTPMVSIELNTIAKLFPFTRPAVKVAVGEIGYHPDKMSLDTVADALMPATWAKNVWRAMTLDDQDAAVSNALTAALASAYYHEQIPGQKEGVEVDPVEMDNFIGRLRNNVSTILLVKAALGIISPVAPKVEQSDLGFRDEFWNLVKRKGNYADALQEFLANHGDKAISYTVAKTDSTIMGAKYPYVKETVDFINNNRDKFKDQSVSTGWYFLVPQATEKDSSYDVYSQMVSMHLRESLQPKELLRQFYIAQGDNAIATAKAEHYKKLDAAKANMDTFTQQQEKTAWSNKLKEMQVLYPTWYSDYKSSEGRDNAEKVVKQLNAIFYGADKANAPTHDQAKDVKTLLDKYNRHVNTINQYSTMGVTGFMVDQEKSNWSDYIYRTSQEYPHLAPIINGVFAKLGQ